MKQILYTLQYRFSSIMSMMTTMNRGLYILLFIALIPQLAAAAPSYTVSPLVIDTGAEPRDILTREITLTNTGTQPLTLYPSVNNISLDDGGTIQEFLPPVESDRTASLASWIEISRSGIKLAKNETKTVPITIRVNPNPKPGVYHAFIGFGFGRNQTEAEKMVAIGRAPGAVLTVTISDEKNEFLRLSKFIINRFVTSGENEGATYTITNPGDEPLTPSGEIIFYNNHGSEVGSLPVNPNGETIAPGDKKEFLASVPVSGLFGKYKAYLTVEYGSQVASVNDTAFFYVLPLKLILLLLGGVCIVVIFFALLIHKRYLDETEMDDSDQLPVHFRESTSDSKEHDINLKQQ